MKPAVPERRRNARTRQARRRSPSNFPEKTNHDQRKLSSYDVPNFARPLPDVGARTTARASLFPLGELRVLPQPRVLGLQGRALDTAVRRAGRTLAQAPLCLGVALVSGALPIAVLDTTVFARPTFRSRANNARIRARYSLATTAHQLREAARLRFFVPPFVEIYPGHVGAMHAAEIAPRDEWGLSRADVALHALVDRLRFAGARVVLVTDDGLLLDRVPGSLDGSTFLEEAVGPGVMCGRGPAA